MSAFDEIDDLDAHAAEYVVGTLDRDERAAFTERLATDEAARRAVAAWEHRLAPLGLAGDAVPPPVELWARIERVLGTSTGDRFRVVDGGVSSSVAIRRSRDRWRVLALSTAGLAAALVAFVVVRDIGDLAPRGSETYVAAVNRGGDKPALIVTVDLKTRQVLVRPVAAQAPVGRSLELWYIGGGRSPHSLGLVTDAAAHVAIPAGADADAGATFAVSVEPPGGSTTGGPTGAVLLLRTARQAIARDGEALPCRRRVAAR